MENSTSAILFDLDGTLVDTEMLAMQVLQAYLADKGHTPSEADLELLFGRPWSVAVELLLQRYPVNKPSRTVEMEVLTLYRQALKKEVPVIRGSKEAVKSLFTAYPLGVVSNSRREDILGILEALGLSKYFQFVIGIEDCAEGKPSPVPYLQALQKLAKPAKSVLVFEDSEVGIRSAQAAALAVVAVGRPPSQKNRPKTHWVIEHFEGIDSKWVGDLRWPS